MNKEKQTSDETNAADTDTANDLSIDGQVGNTQTEPQTNTAIERPTTEPRPEGSQSVPGTDTTTTTQPLTPEPEAAALLLAEINQRLAGLQELLEKQMLRSESAQMGQRLTDLHELFDKQVARNQNQKQMFDTIYREMTSYKEGALLDAYHKPIIHNLIRLYDNLELVESQLESLRKTFESLGSQSEDTSGTFESFGIWFGSLREREQEKILKKMRSFDEKLAIELERFGKEPKDEPSLSQANTALMDEPAQSQEEPEDRLSPSQLQGELSQFQVNLENVRLELEEVLYRMDVTPYEEHLGELDPKLHKTVGTIPADDPDEDRRVVDTHKTGFYWREKVFRPAEVTISRYIQPAGKTEGTVTENPKDEKGDGTDG